jgi:hypothetical protein
MIEVGYDGQVPLIPRECLDGREQMPGSRIHGKAEMELASPEHSAESDMPQPVTEQKVMLRSCICERNTRKGAPA